MPWTTDRTDAVLVGIDIGTTAVKVAAFDLTGQPRCEFQAGHGMTRPGPDRAEQDPLAWLSACHDGLAKVRSEVGRISAIGVVSQVNTHVFVDAQLNPILPAITWQDLRCADVAHELDDRFDAVAKQRIWGGPFTLDASYLPVRAEWLSRNHPEWWQRTAWVLSPKDFVLARLTGAVATDPVSSIGLVDAAGSGYLAEPLALVPGLADRLPPLGAPDAIAGTMAIDGSGPVPVVVGNMDAFGNLYGSGAAVVGHGMVSCGTSAIVAGTSDRAEPQPGVISFPPAHGLRVHAGPTQAGGDALRWWAAATGQSIADALTLAERAEAGAGGVVFTPHLAGERAPLWDPDVRAGFVGIGINTGPAEFARAVLEGVAMSARHVFEVVEAVSARTLSELAISGGGSRSPLWCQIFADVLDRPLTQVGAADTAVLGAALLAGVGVGSFADLAEAGRLAVPLGPTFQPDRVRADRYHQLYGVYRSWYESLRQVHSDLAAYHRSGR